MGIPPVKNHPLLLSGQWVTQIQPENSR